MKIKVILFSAVVFLISACTQTTCPTYTKGSLEKNAKEQIEREQV